MMGLSEAQRQRYARQLVVPQIGEVGQARLRAARVLVVGAGGLGSPALLYLAAAGVGTLGIVEDDVLDLSNLNRQILHGTPDVGRPKVESAAERLAALNPEVQVVPHRQRFEPQNARALVSGYDVALDASDNYETKFLLNQACVEAGVPLVWAAVAQFEGQMSVVLPGQTACRCCVFGEVPQPGTYPTNAELGIVGAVAGVMGALQALEAIKLITGAGESLAGRLLIVDGMLGSFDLISVAPNAACPVCKEGRCGGVD